MSENQIQDAPNADGAVVSSNKAEQTAEPRQRRKIVLGYVLTGIVVTLILAGLKLVIENTTGGRENELWVFGQLQSLLPSLDPDNPIILIDLSDVPDERDGRPVLRETVQEVIEALVNLPQRPMAIAVDVDFSPSPLSGQNAEDAEFFDFCLEQRKKVPILLAVGENKAAAPNQWLGQEEYEDLACAVAINSDDTRKIPIWVKADNQSRSLNTINYALALEYRKRLIEPHPWIGWALDRTEETPEHAEDTEDDDDDDAVRLTYGTRLVNYSKLKAFRLATKKDTSAESVRNSGSEYSRKLIIIGDVSKPRDFFPVPGRRKDRAGSLLLASATYTLIKEPLFEFKHSIRILLDLLIAGVIIFFVALIRYRSPEGLFWLGKQAIFIYISIAVVLIGGVALVWFAGVLWLDFLMVASALFLHPKLEHLLNKISHRRRSKKASPSPAQGSNVPTPHVVPLILVGIVTLAAAAVVQAQDPATVCKNAVAAVPIEIRINQKGNKKKKQACYFGNHKDAKWKELVGADMKTRSFRAGEDLYCDNDCELVLWLCGTDDKVPVNKHPPNWYRVFNAYRAPRKVIDLYPAKPTRERPLSSLRAANPSTRTSSAEVTAAYSERHRETAGLLGDTAARSTARAGTYNRSRNRPEDFVAKAFVRLLNAANKERDAKAFSEAERDYQEASKLMPGDARPAYGLGNVYLDQQKWKQAEDAYRRAIDLVPQTHDVYVALGTMIMETRESVVTIDKVLEAEGLLKTAIEMEPSDENIHNLLYSAMEKRNAADSEMEAAYRRLLRLSPRAVDTNLRLSALLRRRGNRIEARDYLQRAQKAASRKEQFLDVAEALESWGKYSQAERLVQHVLLVDPQSQRALILRGLVLIDRRHYSEALQPLEAAVTAAPSDFAPAYLLGIAQIRIGKVEDAEKSLNAAADKPALRDKERFALGCWFAILGDDYVKNGRTADAERVYRKALGYDPGDLETPEKLNQILEHPKP